MKYQLTRLNNISLVILYFIYRIGLDVVYVKWVNPLFGYTGFSLQFDTTQILISYLFFILIILIVPKKHNKVSDLVLQTHAIFMIIPLTSVYALSNYSTKFQSMAIISFLMQVILLRCIFR